MKTSSTMVIAAILLLAASSAALAQDETGSQTGTSAECNRVFKAKAERGTQISTNQLADELQLPVETVQNCLRQKRQAGPRTTPAAGD